MENTVVKTLRNLEKTRKKYWNVPYSTGEFLSRLILLSGRRRVLEIGTSNGYSGIFMAEALKKNKGTLFTIESHKERYLEAGKNFTEAGVAGSVNRILGHAPEVFPQLDGVFDMIFVDATKMEYQSYYEAIMPKLAVFGFLVADNCLTHADSLNGFLRRAGDDPAALSAVLPFDNGLLICLKTALNRKKKCVAKKSE